MSGSWRRRLRIGRGVARSLLIYYGRPWRFRIMDAFYRRFLRPGDLGFDLGAHVGNRVRSWRSLGCRVVALEPQPALAGVLRRLYGRDPDVRIVEAAIAAAEGALDLHLNLVNPTISTTSAEFLERAAAAESFRGQNWPERTPVAATTLDALIRDFGVPRFVKIDVEGYEAEAVRGLSRPLHAISIEFVPMARVVAEAALDRLVELGDYCFNASYGDEMRLLHDRPLTVGEMRRWLRSLDPDGPAGDVYACLDPLSLHRVSPGRHGASVSFARIS